ncbi:PucR family transcriptional regulator [Paenibacillus sp. GCM10027626]|uniref:PucR family transcriptional regulator n=1 Tax=Paenibacillus sp. GCM10027626 TaxID=3273411 RepID=UPI0036385E66
MREAEAEFKGVYDNLESLADTLSETLQAQLTIEDNHHNVIAYSSHPFENDHARLATIVGRRVPEAVIAGLRKCGVMQQLEASLQAVRIPAVAEVGLGPRLAVCVRRQEEILGYIWVVDRGNLIPGEAERALEGAAEAAKHFLLKRRSRRTKQEHLQNEFLWKILTHSYASSEALIMQDAAELAITLPPSYCIVIFDFQHAVTAEQLDRIRNGIAAAEAQMQPIMLTADHTQVIGVFSAKMMQAGKGKMAQMTALLAGRLQEQGRPSVMAGCSRVEGSYTRAAQAYSEVSELLTVKRLLPVQTRQIWHYEDLGFLMHLPLIMEQKRRKGLASPLLAQLREHDREHKSDLIKTIAVYLSCDCNPKQTASLLHVHINTLHYRLNRVAELTGHHLRETGYLLSLYVDLLTEETELMKGVHHAL